LSLFTYAREGLIKSKSHTTNGPYRTMNQIVSISRRLTSTKQAPQGAIFVRDPTSKEAKASLRENRKTTKMALRRHKFFYVGHDFIRSTATVVPIAAIIATKTVLMSFLI